MDSMSGASRQCSFNPMELPQSGLEPCGVSGISKEELHCSLRDAFYAHIPFEIEPTQIQDTVDSFFALMDLPDATKETLKSKIAPNHRRGDLGFVRRDPTDGAYSDKKEFFHYHPMLLSEKCAQINCDPAIKAFIDNADRIWNKGVETVKDLVGKLESQFPGIYEKIFDDHHTPHVVLRFLRYEWDKTQENLAKAHFDAGSCTLAIAESCPGLRIGSCEADLKLIEHIPRKALFFLASNFKALANSNDLLPGWHDVVLTDEMASKVAQPFTRWAIVMFVEGHSIEAPSRSDTHKTDLQARM